MVIYFWRSLVISSHSIDLLRCNQIVVLTSTISSALNAPGKSRLFANTNSVAPASICNSKALLLPYIVTDGIETN